MRNDRAEQDLDTRSLGGLGSTGRALLALIALVLVGWALHAMAAVLVPVVFALMTALIIAPLDQSIAARLPSYLKWLGRLAVMTVLFFIIAGFAIGLVYCAEQLLSQLPSTDRMDEALSSRLPDLSSGGESEGILPSWLVDAIGRSGNAITGWLASTTGSVLGRVAGATGTLVTATLLVVFLVLLILAETDTWQAKVQRLWGGQSAPALSAAIASTAFKLRRWLLVRSGIGVLSAVAYVAWLALFGVDLLPVWALLTFLLVFIPNLGAVISGVLPTLYAFFTKDYVTALWVAIGLTAIENIIGNWVDPRFQGRQIAVSPVVIFVALLLWSWLWGVPGAFLSTPITVAIMVICAHVDAARWFALILSNQSDLNALDEKLRA